MIGSKDEPFEHKAIITLHGHVRSKELPTYGAKVLALRQGMCNEKKRWLHSDNFFISPPPKKNTKRNLFLDSDPTLHKSKQFLWKSCFILRTNFVATIGLIYHRISWSVWTTHSSHMDTYKWNSSPWWYTDVFGQSCPWLERWRRTCNWWVSISGIVSK